MSSTRASDPSALFNLDAFIESLSDEQLRRFDERLAASRRSMAVVPADLERTTDTAARLLLNVKTVERMCRDGRFDGAKKVGNAWRVPKGAMPASRTVNRSEVRPTSTRRGRKIIRGEQPAKTAAERAILGSRAGNIAAARTLQSGPGDVGASRGPAHRSSNSMSTEQNSSGVKPATVTRLHTGGAR